MGAGKTKLLLNYPFLGQNEDALGVECRKSRRAHHRVTMDGVVSLGRGENCLVVYLPGYAGRGAVLLVCDGTSFGRKEERAERSEEEGLEIWTVQFTTVMWPFRKALETDFSYWAERYCPPWVYSSDSQLFISYVPSVISPKTTAETKSPVL